ncbi:oxidoreductase [Microtetraspora sp. NBRC 13810]|uniref:aldo/keto reductase n=1 Tax=Microtetraspora sp. NBRC 13810 TaxID=3030990 RepID=UPI0024A2EAA6|nr:aldo/keto reductase [Microtetraspora sp. NBRC 13810]GLW07055.1 oxidoreductase [Microtetraspora sp. NBRC 13810]
MLSSNDPSRRAVVRAGVTGAGALFAAAAVGGPAAGAAASPAPRGLITRRIPGTDVSIPAVGLGTFMTWDKRPEIDRRPLRQVLKTFYDNGGRVVDTSALYGTSETNLGEAAAALGIADELFVTGKSWTTGDYLNEPSHAEAQFAQTVRRLGRNPDVLQVHSLTNAEMNVPILRRWKQEGRIRFLGVTHHVIPYYPALENWVRTGDVDFVQLRYSIFMREAERRILPAAADTDTAVMVNMALEKDRLHRIVRNRRVPEFAREELGVQNWAQFFIKFVLGHPAVTCVLVATGNPEHMAQNIGALRGPVPTGSQRRQMVKYMEGVPGFSEIGNTPWYPGRTWNQGVVRLTGNER